MLRCIVGMRAAILLFCAACAGSMRPAVIPTLSELPKDPERRDAVLDSAHAEPGPEQKPASKRARKVETAAATAAAVIGVLFSKSPNVTLGMQAPVDENRLFEDAPKGKPKQDGQRDADQDGKDKDKAKQPPAASAADATALVPWVRLK